ncbi:MAG: alpha/beta hydrolase [Actinomycetota bacterium]
MVTTTEGTARNGEIELPWIRSTGEGTEPLLLINGLSSPRVSYEEGFVDALVGRGFDVVRYDNRDAGRATPTQGGYLLADMANDAIAVIDAVGWETAHVFGMSMGGMIVQQLGIDHADRLRSITSVMSATGNPEYGTSSKEAREALMTPAPTEREAWLAHRLKTEPVWASPAEWTPEGSRAKGELMYDYGVQPQSVIHQYTAIMSSPPREDALREVQTKTLVLHGDKDTLLHKSGGERTAELMPNSTYVELVGMGHDLPAAYWPRIGDLVAEHAGVG